jgi:hypothetical protein
MVGKFFQHNVLKKTFDTLSFLSNGCWRLFAIWIKRPERDATLLLIPISGMLRFGRRQTLQYYNAPCHHLTNSLHPDFQLPLFFLLLPLKDFSVAMTKKLNCT